MKYWKPILIAILFVLAIAAAWYSGYKSTLFQTHSEENTQVLLNRIEKVMKLVAVEGHFSEVYNYKDYQSLNWEMFTKKALIRINAKASVGYDFEKLKLNIDSRDKTITIEDFPAAEVLSIDHDLDYYDISQGTFNKFKSEDYNEINRRAKEYIRKAAETGDLMQSAEEQKEELINTLRLLLKGMGWTLVEKKDNLLG